MCYALFHEYEDVLSNGSKNHPTRKTSFILTSKVISGKEFIKIEFPPQGGN